MAKKKLKARIDVLRTLAREKEEIRRTLQVLRKAGQGLLASQLPRMAAALAYRTIFSIIPVFVIGLLVIRAFVSPEQVQQGVAQALQFAGLDQIAVQTAPGPAEGALKVVGVETPEDRVADAIREEQARRTLDAWQGWTKPGPRRGEPEQGVDAPPEPTLSGLVPGLVSGAGDADRAQARQLALDELIEGLVAQVNESVSGVQFGLVGLISVLVLVYAAMALLIEVEDAFNSIYHAPRGRGWGMRVALYWTVLTLGTVFLVATFYVGEQFRQWAAALVSGGDVSEARSWPIRAIGFVVTVAISSVLLLLAYTLVPNTRVRLRPALVAAVVAAVLWEASKWGFRAYLSYSSGYQRFYGSLALLPLFLVWVYLTWLLILFGLSVAHMLQTFREWEFDESSRDPRIVDPALVLPVCVTVARRFEEGKTADAQGVAESLGLTGAMVELMFGRLMECGILRRVAEGSDEERVVLARPADKIRAASVLEVGFRMAGTLVGEDGTMVLGRLNRERIAALGDRTLAEIAQEEASGGDAGGWEDLRACPAAEDAEGPAPGGAARASPA